MIDFLNILEYFPIYLLILHSHNGKKYTQNINWQWHTSTKITLLVFVKATQ